MLTELEGAILTEIGFRARKTAFRVRQAFKESASSEWRGSAGSVYPAIKRLVERGFIAASGQLDGRKTQELSVTVRGHTELEAWLMNAQAAISIGMDPFRLRAGLLSQLPDEARARQMRVLIAEIERDLIRLEACKKGQDALEKTQIDLAIDLQSLRLDWLARRLSS
jgi:DNA-binding PadR family transcriptional regulator